MGAPFDGLPASEVRRPDDEIVDAVAVHVASRIQRATEAAAPLIRFQDLVLTAAEKRRPDDHIANAVIVEVAPADRGAEPRPQDLAVVRPQGRYRFGGEGRARRGGLGIGLAHRCADQERDQCDEASLHEPTIRARW